MAVFEVFVDDEELIYHSQSPSPEVKLVNPRLTLEDNAAGSFTCSIPTSNRGYEKVNRLTSEIVIYRDKSPIWAGRIIDEKQDFWGNRQITCEGELAYLNDTTQPPSEYHNQTVRGFLETLISKHNAKANVNKMFRVGVVTVTDPNDSIYRYTNFESTLDCIADKLVDRLGGHIKVRREDGVRYIDYIAEPLNTNSQTIEFGKNLVDFSKSWDLSDFATVIVPQGSRLDESPIEALDAYLDVSSVNGGSIYVYDQETVNNYGWIETVVKWDDVTIASNLLTKAKKYLSEIQFENMVLELSAVDLHYMNVNTEAIDLLDKIRCVSRPHGMDKFFPVTRIDIPLDSPDDTTFTLGDNTVKTSLSGAIKTGNSKLQQQIDEMPSTTSVLDEAKANSDQIMRQLSNGYITTVISGEGEDAHSEKLIISDTKNYLNASRYWEWGINGLAYYKNKSNLGLALTMDGAINADKITTGHLKADIISGGVLKDLTGNITWNLNSGEMLAENLRIEAPNFFLDYNGELKSGTNNAYVDIYDGSITSVNGLYSSLLDGGNLKFFYRDYYVGEITSSNAGWQRGSLYIIADDYLYLDAGHIYINGVAAETSDTTWVRASNGRVMGISHECGFFTGYTLQGDYGYDGWVYAMHQITSPVYDGSYPNWDSTEMYFSEGVLQQVDYG